MFLKNYQIKVIKNIKQFIRNARETKTAIETVTSKLKGKIDKNINWVQSTFQNLQLEFKDNTMNGLGNYYPRVTIKVPTGGGKTLLAVETIREYQNLYAKKRTGLVVWIVPTESIYSQTIERIKDKSNHLRQIIDQCSGGRTIILEKGQKLTMQDIEENLVILFVMIQSISRKNNKEALRVFQDSGGYESFFPSDNRYDLHKILLKEIPNLDYISYLGTDNPLIKTSLGNAIRASRPFIIIDEIHKVFTPTAKKTIDNLNPEFVLGLTATPRINMNIISSVTGIELKEEEMIKLDMHILPPQSKSKDDWRSMINEIITHRDNLEKKCIELKRNTGKYIRPIALIQVEATGKDQRGRGRVHSLDVRDYLIKNNINPENIAIKTSSQNDIEDVNLFSSDCPIRFIITKEALREGWDCSFAYILGIIPNVNSNTGVTQLVGRILRQPFAKKLGIRDLDESYIYYSKGNTRYILERVEAGFKNEGLEDLVGKILVNKIEEKQSKIVNIRKEIIEKYNHALYLPVWLIKKNGTEKRRFSYDVDIRSKFNFSDLDLSKSYITEIKDSISGTTLDNKSFTVSLDRDSKTTISKEDRPAIDNELVNINYLTRRFSEYIDNPFQARKLADKWLERIKSNIDEPILKSNFNFITSMLVDRLKEEKERSEENIFMDYLRNGELILALSDDDIGFHMPKKDIIGISRIPSTYDNYLYEDIDPYSLNSLERRIGDLLDCQDKICWWTKNKVAKQWYAIQGWKEHKIRPDFIAAKQKNNGKIELLYVLEAKGEHLLGNKDTLYKKSVLDLMTSLNKKGEIKTFMNQKLPLLKINDRIEFYLIEDGNEGKVIRSLFI